MQNRVEVSLYSVPLFLILVIWNNFKNTVKSDKGEGRSAVKQQASGKAFVPQGRKIVQEVCKWYFFPYSNNNTFP